MNNSRFTDMIMEDVINESRIDGGLLQILFAQHSHVVYHWSRGCVGQIVVEQS